MKKIRDNFNMFFFNLFIDLNKVARFLKHFKTYKRKKIKQK